MSGNASLQGTDFQLVGMAIGKSYASKVLGIGGLNKESMVLEAKQNMYANHPLRRGEAFANVSVDFREAFYVLFSRTTVTISADIVRFGGGEQGSVQPLFNTPQDNKPVYSAHGISVGDTVKLFTARFQKNAALPVAFVVKEVLPKNNFRIADLDGNSEERTADVSDLFLTKKNDSFYEVGRLVKIKNTRGQYISVRILGRGERGLLVEDADDSSFYVRKPEDVLVEE
jgi:hypothetical protein